MNLEVDVERLQLARKAVRADLMAEQASDGHWVGQLSSSPFATAAAISALVMAHRRDSDDALQESSPGSHQMLEQIVQGDLCELLVESVNWLARHQNDDGGWGDCEAGQSNLAATLLVQAAFRLTGIPAKYADLMVRADDYVEAQGGISALRKHVSDKMLLAPILSNCALADMIAWRQVPTLPYELACLPKRWQRQIQLPMPRGATPIFIAVGRARFHHDPPRNPVTRWLRNWTKATSITVLRHLQAADDSYLGSPAFTAFVVMNVASIGCQDHAIVTHGVEFLLSSVRSDASWALATNMAVTNTALTLAGLAVEKPSAGEMKEAWRDEKAPTDDSICARCEDWLLARQRTKPDPVTNVGAGGWAGSDSPGALPNTVDTARALLSIVRRQPSNGSATGRIEGAAELGSTWLLDLQNEDGGWPMFYRDGGTHGDASCSDATAMAARALFACQGRSTRPISERIGPAIDNAWRYLVSQQQQDGSFAPAWFGNEHTDDKLSPVCGTALVLQMCVELGRLETDLSQRASRWLAAAQHANGGWGPPRVPVDYSGSDKEGQRDWRTNEDMAKFCSVEETALSLTALYPLAEGGGDLSQAVSRGLNWLINAVEQDRHRQPAIVGYYLSRLWYHERQYPLAFAAEALERAVRPIVQQQPAAERVSLR
jgi:squalene-hopene/tetraprenyl-beta-curcumene cyclase